jgi:hypothetical protein
LKKDATSLDLLRAIYKHPRMPLETRIECANLALPYEHPRLIAVMPAGMNSTERHLIIHGGLPRLPGANTLMPGDPQPAGPLASPSSVKLVPQPSETDIAQSNEAAVFQSSCAAAEAEVEVGTCIARSA